MFLKITKKRNSGFTLVEMMVFIFIFSVVSLTFYKLFTTGTQAMGNVRHRLDALALANEKIEIIRNLNYEDVGTTNGIPVGKIEENETAVRDSKNFFIKTNVIVVDDPFDGTQEGETDSNSSDYKQVRVQVSWEKDNPSKEVVLVSTMVPPGLESVFTGGILSLHVVDNSGQGISNAHVTIKNEKLNPVVNTTLTTDEFGNLFIPQATPANQSYNIQVSKSGYFPMQTYAPYPESPVNPVDIDATVVGGAINQKTLVTDKFSTINISTKTPLGFSVPNISFGLEGGKQIGNTVVVFPEVSKPIWSYKENSLNSGPDGDVDFENMSSGAYFFTYGNSTENSNYVFLHMEPVSNLKTSFNVSPDDVAEQTAVVADKNIDSVLVTVVDDTDGTLIAGASVELKNADSSYDVTLTSDKFGQVYFPDSSMPLVAGEYELKISASGYRNIEGKVINVDKLKEEEIKMIQE